MIRINASPNLQCSETFTCAIFDHSDIVAKDGFEWLPMQNAAQVRQIVKALELISDTKKTGPGIDDFFKTLKIKQSLSAIIADKSRVISISRSSKGTGVAETAVLAISIMDRLIGGPLYELAGTLLHELAHSSGAMDYDMPNGGGTVPAAERVLNASRLFASQFVASNIILAPGASQTGRPAIRPAGSLGLPPVRRPGMPQGGP